MSNIYLVLYVITWVVTIIFYQKKKKHLDAGSVILFSYFLYSIASLILFNNPFSIYTFNSLNIFPFVYLYLLIILAALPVLKFDDKRIKEIQKPNILLLNSICLIFIIASLAHLPTIFSNFSSSIVKLFANPSGGEELYRQAMSNSYSTGDGNISNLAAIISGSFSNLGVLFLFYYLTLENSNKIILTGLFLSVIVIFFSDVSLGQRGLLVELLFTMLITYFAIRKFLKPNIKKIVKIVGIFLIVATLVPLFALTISRFGNSQGGSQSSFFYYVGQENLYFNNYGLNDGGLRYGDRTFPLFKSILGFQNVPHNFWERREKYPKLKINDEVFIGFVGDFTLDFGPFVTTLIFVLFTIFFLNRTKTRNSRILFHQLILLHFVMCLVMLGGMKLYPFSDVGGNLQVIVYTIAYLSFRLDYEKKMKEIK